MKFFKKSILIYYFTLLFVSFLANQYYAYLGVLPIDTFLIFNSGFDLLNGTLPFKDVWTIKGPFLDLIQALFFKVFGVSWFSYASHASVFNSLFALSTFWTLNKFGLNLKFSFLYSVLASLLMYPTYGIPFSDHHVSILSMISIYCLLIAIKTGEKNYWFFIPILLFCAFFSKQVPSGYFLILISIISLIYFAFNFSFVKIFYVIFGTLTILFVFFLIIYLGQISISSIFEQYILFPLSLGETRTEWLFPIEFKRVVLRHKLGYIALMIPIYFLIRNCINNLKNIYSNESLITYTLVGTLMIFIFHQLMTINGLFIFFVIPVFCGFSHTFLNKKIKYKNYLINSLIILSFVSTIHYQNKYISKRDTLFLRNVDLNKAVDASKIHRSLKGLKWITINFPLNPELEISKLNGIIEIIKKDERNKMIVTDYQFITVMLNIQDFAASRFWWRHHGYPDTKNEFFYIWKKFLIEKIKKNRIEVIYTIKPLIGESDILENILDEDCYSKSSLSKSLEIQILRNCKNLIN